MSYKLGFVGLGVMGGTILSRFMDTSTLSPESIVVFDALSDKVAAFTARGATKAASLEDVLSAEVVFLAVKPQNYKEILQNNQVSCRTLVSIMAGVKTETLLKLLPEGTSVCRIMPNTPAFVGKGASGVTFVKVIDEDKALIEKILTSMGEYVEISEDKFDAVTAISGPGPAYVYMFAAALTKAGIEGGLSPEESKALALQTIEGSAAYAKIAEFDLDALTERVCSKGGTTIEAVQVFREEGLEKIVSDAVKACRLKSEELSRKL